MRFVEILVCIVIFRIGAYLSAPAIAGNPPSHKHKFHHHAQPVHCLRTHRTHLFLGAFLQHRQGVERVFDIDRRHHDPARIKHIDLRAWFQPAETVVVHVKRDIVCFEQAQHHRKIGFVLRAGDGDQIHAELCAAADELDIANPVALASRETRVRTFAIEVGRCVTQQRCIKILERIDIDYRVNPVVDAARDHRHDAALHADMEFRRACTKRISRYARRVFYRYLQYAARIGRPDTAVLDAERTAARVGRNEGGIGLPRQAERNIPAVASTVDQHRCDLRCCEIQFSGGLACRKQITRILKLRNRCGHKIRIRQVIPSSYFASCAMSRILGELITTCDYNETYGAHSGN